MIRSFYKVTVAAFLGRDSAEVLVDQLDELYELRTRSEGPTKAKLWYCYQLLVGLSPVVRFWLSERLFVKGNVVGHLAVAFVSDKAPSRPYPQIGVVIGVLTFLLTLILVTVPTLFESKQPSTSSPSTRMPTTSTRGSQNSSTVPPTTLGVPNADNIQHTESIDDQLAGNSSQPADRVPGESTYLRDLASARNALESGHIAQAEKILKRILKSHPDDEKARNMLTFVMYVKSAEREHEK